MKVDIYQVRGKFRFLIVGAGASTDEIVSCTGIKSALRQFASDIEIPSQSSEKFGLDSEVVNHDLNEQGWSLQPMQLVR